MPNLFRGALSVTIHEAQSLPAHETLQSKVTGFFKNITGKENNVDHLGVYINVMVGNIRVSTTSTFEHGDELNPTWGEHFRIDLAHECREISFILKGDRFGPDKTLGIVKFDGDDIMKNPDNPDTWKLLPIEGNERPKKNKDWCQIVDKRGNMLPGSLLRLTMSFESASKSTARPNLVDTYFPMRTGCKVTLYQDAATPHSDLFDKIILHNGSTYKATNAFRDIYDAISNAQHFIYITGWSVWAKVVLVREEGSECEPLGELLKRKSKEGVRVLGMVWDEKASTNVTPGLMGTHDEETAAYFKGTGVDMILVYRKKEPPKGLHGISEACAGTRIAIDQLYSTCYSHHQKCVIVDAEHPHNGQKRRLVSFIGGLDLTSGRYDTPNHELFSTINSTHKDDFYQNCTTVPAAHGPRQPWHDIHSKVEGQLAADAINNFEERWLKQAPGHLKNRLLDIRTNSSFDTACTSHMESGSDWNCQLFRSITSDSVDFDKDKMTTLTKKAKAVTEDSIHRCYVHQIQRAKRFIYIENQYFLGSAYAWISKNIPKAHHIIPFELMNKVVEKIEANEPFHIYIVIPMFPEGDPTSAAIQEILHWQTNTMVMMYTRIAKAIKEYGRNTKPTDYLSFYCLGKREKDDPHYLPTPVDPESSESKLRQTRRFLIYVHSKMMIVDDTYIIVGSANINQRSMGGSRDTEIAVGSYQPNHIISTDGKLPKGNVYGFRMALFAEHLKTVEPVFNDPGSFDCVRRIRELAQVNWDAYVADEVMDTPGFLMNYPISITEHDGNVWPLAKCKNFPDTKGFVLGAKSNVLPDKLTT